MKGCRGIENPAFVASSPDTPRRLCASPSNVEVSVLSTNTRREDSQPQEPQDPQKSPEPPLSSVTPAGSQERPRPESLSEFEEGPCGWGTFQPQCLQRCNTPQGFLFHYCLLALTQDTCLTPKNRTSCTTSSSSLFNYLYVFILGQLLLGVGGTPLYTLGTAFIDDSVPTHKSSLYIGIGYSMSVLGPAVGYVLGGQLLTLYIDVDLGQSTDITEDDPRWLGAWWIGFLMSWFLAWSLIIPFSCFPKHLPGTAEIQDGKTSQAHQSNSLQNTDGNFGQSFKDFPAALKNLMRNTVFMCLVLSTCSEALVTTGFATFLPKFIENQFGLSSSSAATLGGAVLVPGAALGQILGGVLVSKFKMTCKNIMKFALLTSVIALTLSFVFLYANCENEPFAGVSESYNR
nr:solute carrier organic anion transporter family member 4C1-like isoform X2 [Camelus bactrianus]